MKILTLISVMLPSIASAITILGDSHVGGLKPYLQKYMHVKFKNGSTSRYWSTKHIHDDKLIVVTGTNDSLLGISPMSYISNLNSICKGASKKCYIVAPHNSSMYYGYLKDRKDVIWTQNHDTRDGIHYYQNGYKKMAKEIIDRIK